jgi:CMP-N,N'-diacetyllegionaminic acid synthase
VMPFFTEGHEGFDVNHPFDWRLAEDLAAAGEARLPSVDREAYRFESEHQHG